MRLELFDYDLPPERIAQTPIEPRDASRLLVLRSDGSREHRRFLDLPEYLNAGDLLVFNDTRVLPARLFGRKVSDAPGGGARVEALLLRRIAPALWEALVHPGRRLREGTQIVFETGAQGPALAARVTGRGEDGTRLLEFTGEDAETVEATLRRAGRVPLPPYIHAELPDPERYQTVYSREEGSAAAPTAGLHFTDRVFEALRERGVGFAYVTLHVGLATFRPVKTDEIEEHSMHAEWYHIPQETAEAIRTCRGRVVAVGTTTVRCLESAALGKAEGRRMKDEGALSRELVSLTGLTRLYITPGFRFRVVDAMVTNFHMPRSSLLILVSAFTGLKPIRAAYQEALARGYRFLSFGDAMFIERNA